MVADLGMPKGEVAICVKLHSAGHGAFELIIPYVEVLVDF